MTPEKIERMSFRERKWWLNRLTKQLKAERDAIDQVNKKRK
jgi:hypothetical protein